MNKIVQQLRDNIPNLKYLAESEIFVMPSHRRTIFFDNRMSIVQTYEKIVVKFPKLVFVNCFDGFGEYVFALNEEDTVCYPPLPNILNNLKICVTVTSKTAKNTARNFFNSGFTNSGMASLSVYDEDYGHIISRLFADLNSGKLELIPLRAEITLGRFDMSLR